MILFFVASAVSAQMFGIQQIDHFSVTITSDIKAMYVDKTENEKDYALGGQTTYYYTTNKDNEVVTYSLDSLQVKTTVDQKITFQMSMDSAKVSSYRLRTDDIETVPVDQLPEGMKKQVQDSFSVPLFQRTGDEITILAQEGAQNLLDNGLVQNLILFHPTYKEETSWTVPCQISMGNGGYAKGDLTYEVSQKENFQIVFSVKGTLQPDLEKKPVSIKTGFYKVQGTHTYNVNTDTWVKGNLSIQVQYVMNLDNAPYLQAKGMMDVTFQKNEEVE
jgi:hypothetical protein